jgi:hypothetical protein
LSSRRGATLQAWRNRRPRAARAKDLLRAARLQLLPRDDSEVAKDLRGIAGGEALSPVLLVRGAPLLVADGYHRICASYYIAEDADIPCRLVDAP